MCLVFISNCAKIALPKVSAVMPVPSEMKKTVRCDMAVWMKEWTSWTGSVTL
jgi:hypothetical protein